MTVLSALARRPVQAAIQSTPWGPWGDSGTSYAGVDVTTTSALQLLTVYGCNRFICDGISTLPVHTFADVDGVRTQVPLPDWLKKPTRDLDFVAWASQVLTSWLLAGNTFVLPSYTGDRRVVSEVTPLDPTRITVRREASHKMIMVNGRPYTGQQIHHAPGVMFPGADVGMAPLEAARQMIGSGLATEEFAGKFFAQGAVMSGVIQNPGDLAPEKARQMARDWARSHSGKSKSHLPGVLVGGAEWKPTGVSNEQAQFLETRGFTASQIAAEMFLIDPAEMGLPVPGTSLTYTNQEERSIRKVQVTFLSWIIRLENLISWFLPAGQYAKLNVAGLLRGDMKARFESYKLGLAEDFITVDEVRRWEELPPLPERPTSPPALADQIDAVGQLIRAGFAPEAALAFLGLPNIAHTGLVPVTVKEDPDAA